MMLYLNENDLISLGLNWLETVEVIESAVKCLHEGHFSQPIKPYLRYGDPKNRIIAMPAFVGGTFNKAGIKWIASFPDNIKLDIPRAHSVVILNNAESGVPEAIINTPLLSIVRTASVSGFLIKEFDKARSLKRVNIGITGFGPIGQNHLKVCSTLLADKIENIYLYDIREIDRSLIDPEIADRVKVVDSWQEAYREADIFMTCTVSKEPYIDLPPKKGSLQLNTSLRDYKTVIFEQVKDGIIVDNWEEVCRAKTDIEMMHKEKGLQKGDVKDINDVLIGSCLRDYPEEQAVMFNPMGMGVFDIATASYFLEKALARDIGRRLD